MDCPVTTLKYLKGTANLKDYNEIYQRYSSALLGVLIRDLGDKVTAEECLVSCFVKAWQDWVTNGPREEKIFIWLLRIAKKEAWLMRD